MDSGEDFPGPPAILGAEGGGAQHVQPVFVPGIHEQLDVVPGALHQAGIAGYLGPASSRVGREVQPAGVSIGVAFDQGIDLFRVGPAHRNGHLAHLVGKAPGELLPGFPPVSGLVESAAGASAEDLPGEPAVLPHGGVQDARIVGIQGQLRRSGFLVHEQHVLPGYPSVGRFEDSPLPGGAVESALGGHQHHVGIPGINHDPGDMPRFIEARLLPGAAGVGGAVHPVTRVGHHSPDGMFSHPYIDHVGVGRRHCDRPDRAALEESIGDVTPGNPHVLGLPHSATGDTHVVGLRITRYPRSRDRPASPERPDRAPLDRLQQAVEGRRGSRAGLRRKGRSGYGNHRENEERSGHGELGSEGQGMGVLDQEGPASGHRQPGGRYQRPIGVQSLVVHHPEVTALAETIP